MVRKRKWKPKTRQLNEVDPVPKPRFVDAQKARDKTMQRAVKLLAAKARSIEELRERLLEKDYASEEIVASVLEKLIEYQYLDDERFAVGYASSKVRQQPVGRRRLQRALELKKVDREIADEAIKIVFEQTPESELIDRAIEKRLRLRGLPKTRAQTKSLLDHLLRQGFSYELVIQKVRGAAAIDIDDAEPS
jgi:regulatory protein